MRYLKSRAPSARSTLLTVLFTLALLPFQANGAEPPIGRDEALARIALAESGVEGGLLVHIHCGDGSLSAELAEDERFQLHALSTDPGSVEQTRARLESTGRYGDASVDRFDGERLPYIDDLVTLVVAASLGDVPMEEVLRVLRPGGVAMIYSDTGWERTIKPRPPEIDEWTHFLHDASNNAVAHDRAIDVPRRLQWTAGPYWSRHHDHMASTSAMVSASGRMFYILDEGSRWSIELPSKWALVARDAFSGVALWKRPIERWHTQYYPLKSGPSVLPRRLVADGETVFATLSIDAPLTALDAATGETIRTYAGTAATEEIIFHDRMLFLLVNDPANLPADFETIEAARTTGGRVPYAEPVKRVAAVDPESGDTLWRHDSVVMPTTLAADGRSVYFHNGASVVCLDRESGDVRWRSEPVARWDRIQTFYSPTLVIYEDVVLFSGGEKMVPHRGGDDTLTALDAETGEKLWSAPHPAGGYQSAEDLLVAGGLVWSGATTGGGYSGVFTGRDPRTGEVVSEFGPDVDTYWFHHRCYRGKATDDYLLMSRTGIEFLDLEEESWTINHWVRGGCLYGIMPCNGLIYTPPHNCACYPEAKLYGFVALAPESEENALLAADTRAGRFERGPAFGTPMSADSDRANQWPTYRNDNARSGRTPARGPSDPETAWTCALEGRLSAPVVAAGKVFVARVDAHQVCAIDEATGRLAWTYTTGGRVDSPPTIYAGRVYFGSTDGWVYCLGAEDGQLVWRYRAAPVDRRLVAYNQVESVWPVHGSVLVQNGAVCFAVGRSAFLDGGLKIVRLDAETGTKLSEKRIDGTDPETGGDLQDRVQVLNMPVGLPDILSSDGERMYMRSQVMDLEGNRLEIGPHSGDPAGQGSVQRGETAHLISPNGFLDGSWFHRMYWIYGRSFAGGHAGYYQAGRFAPAGRILVFDESTVYGYGRKPEYLKWTTPIEYRIFASPKEAPAVGPNGRPIALTDTMVQVPNAPSLDPAGKPLVIQAWARADKPHGVVVARGGPAQGYALILHQGRPRFLIRTNDRLTVCEANTRIVGRWAHITGVLTPEAEMRIYVDGKLAGRATSPDLIAAEPQQAMEIGADDRGSVGEYKGPNTLTGLIDDVRIWHGTMTDEEIARSARGAPGSVETPAAKLVFATSLDDGKATDLSGGGHHGTVVAATAEPGRFGGALRFTARMTRGGGSFVQPRWATDSPLYARAMVLAGDVLWMAGPPDTMDEENLYRSPLNPQTRALLQRQDDALAGREGSLLLGVSRTDGSVLAKRRLDNLPVWDGMAATDGKLFLTTRNGEVICLSDE